MLTLIKNGYVIDPASGREGIYDVLIKGERIDKVAAGIEADEVGADTVIDATGDM
jgi:dihydroorotase